MKKAKLIHSRLEIKDVQQEIKIDENNQNLYYIDNGSTITICELENMPKKSNLFNLSLNCTPLDNGKSIEINFELSSDKLSKALEKPGMFKERGNIVKTLQHCYKQLCADYNNSNMLELLSNAYNDNEGMVINKKMENFATKCKFRKHRMNLEWMLQRELESEKSYYVFTRPMLNLGSYLMDVDNCQFISNKSPVDYKTEARFRGGILVNDNDNDWIYDFINLSSFTLKEVKKNKVEYFNTSASLIICSKDMCSIWMNKVIEIDGKMVVHIINSKKTHDLLTYSDLQKADFIIVTTEFLQSKQYKKTWDDYPSTTLQKSFDILRKEYFNCIDLTCDYKKPVISLLYWNRIILDATAAGLILENKWFKELFFTLEGYYRWFQLDKLPVNYDGMVTLLKCLIKNTNINLPLYSNQNKLVYLTNVIRINNKDTFNDDKIKVKHNIIHVKMLDFEKQVYNYFIENSTDRNNKNFNKILLDCIDQFSINCLSRKEVFDDIKNKIRSEINKTTKLLNEDNKIEIGDKISKLSRRLENISIDIDKECNICCTEKTNTKTIIASCTHNFCIDCTLNIIKTSGKCPYCRADMDIQSLYRLKKGKSFSSKVNSLNKLLNDTSGKKLVLCKSNSLVKLLFSSLTGKKVQNKFRCYGTHSGKLSKISKFNELSSAVFIIGFDDVGMLGSFKDVDHVIFYNEPYLEKIVDKNKLQNSDMFHSSTMVHYLSYENTIEDRWYSKFED